MLVRLITWCSVLIVSTRKFIDINQDIDILTDSESSGSRDVEKVKLNVKLDGVSLNRVKFNKIFGCYY